MMKKIWSSISLIGLGTILAGCDTSAAEAMDITTELETTEQAIVEQLNAITSQETTLQPEFEATLAEDEELKTLSDGTAAVFENIDTRQTSLESLKEATDELKAHTEELKTIDSESLPKEEMSVLSDDLSTVTSSLEQFISQYDSSLTEQETYFQSLAEKDASFETLESGVTQINENHMANNALLTELDDSIAQMQASRSQATESLNKLEESTK